MDRAELQELHYITPMANASSILQHGILSHNRAARIPHASVAAQEIQDRRVRKRVPGGLLLHDYVNLYIHARNPMLYKRLSRHLEICVLTVSPAVLDHPGVVLTDQNAASDYVRFARGADGLRIVDRELALADDWRDANQIRQWQKASARCAEVLVPHCVPVEHVLGAYVSCQVAAQRFASLGAAIRATVNEHLFFR